MRKHCCKMMTHYLNWSCDQHSDPFDCPDWIIIYLNKFDEYGIPVHDGTSSFAHISHCPWCGSKLPESKRIRWFKELKALGFDDPLLQDDIPEQYKSDVWWRNKD